MSRTGFLVAVVCAAAAAFGGGLATLVVVKNTNSSPDEGGGAHPREGEAVALQHRLAVVESQLAEVTATVALLTTTIGTETDPVRSSNRRLIVLMPMANPGGFVSSRDQYILSHTERFENLMKRPDVAPAIVLGNSMAEDEVEATPPSDNEL